MEPQDFHVSKKCARASTYDSLTAREDQIMSNRTFLLHQIRLKLEKLINQEDATVLTHKDAAMIAKRGNKTKYIKTGSEILKNKGS